MNQRRHNAPLVLAVVAVGLCALEWLWLSWRHDTQLARVREEIAYLKTELSAIQRQALPHSATDFETDEPDEERLARALERLASKNIIDRYQAGLTVREHGDLAVPGLLELVNGASRNAREAALIILAGLESPAALPGLRKLAAGYFAEGAEDPPSPSPRLDPETVAGVLGVLARTGDREALPLFRKALASDEETVRAAAIVGLRRTAGYEALPELVARLGSERHVVHQELERALRSLCRSDPEKFGQMLAVLPPASRFAVVTFLSRDSSPAATAALKGQVEDEDPRVALGAARALAMRGDGSGRSAAARLAEESSDETLRSIARDIVDGLEGK